jgi:lipopolysaccharide export LptBFGC system permease protein LptF
MRLSAIICFVLAGLSATVAVVNVLNYSGSAGSSYKVGYAVGSFLLPLIFLVAGLSLANKPKD